MKISRDISISDIECRYIETKLRESLFILATWSYDRERQSIDDYRSYYGVLKYELYENIDISFVATQFDNPKCRDWIAPIHKIFFSIKRINKYGESPSIMNLIENCRSLDHSIDYKTKQFLDGRYSEYKKWVKCTDR